MVSSTPANPTSSQNRLERFRALRAKLDPAGEPADAIERFYVEVPQSISARIAAELTLAPTSTHLVVGGVGSGKTTQLLAIKQHMANIKDVATHYIDVSRQHDIAKMRPGAVVAQVGLALADGLQRAGNTSPAIASAQAAANGYYQDPRQELEDRANWEDPGVYVPGILVPPEQLAHAVRRVQQPLAGLLDVLRLTMRHLVVMLDGLDRIADLAAFEQLIDHDIKSLTSLGVGVVLVGPLRALYGLDRVLFERFDNTHYQPWIDVTRDLSGRAFLAAVLRERAADAFDGSALEPLIENSGGVLRDLLSLAQSALVDAYMGGAERAGDHEVDEAIETFGRKHLQGLRPGELDALQRVRTRGIFVQTSEDDLGLLMTRRVLEYRTDNQLRYAVHPTIDDLLRKLAA